MAVQYARDQGPGYLNRIEKVAIIGAGGNIGRSIIEALVQKGNHVVTAITRPGGASALPDNIQVVQINFGKDDETELVNALKGQQVLIVTIPLAVAHGAVSKIIRAALAAHVPYIFPSWFGHDPLNEQLCTDSMLTAMLEAACSEIKNQGVSSYLLLACGFWYEFSLSGGADNFGFDLKKQSLILFDEGDVPINTSTLPLCGTAVANLLSLKILPEDETDPSNTISRFRNAPVYISSFRVSQRDMFESLKRVTRTTDDAWTVTRESAVQRWSDGQDTVRKGDQSAWSKMLYSCVFRPGQNTEYCGELHNTVLDLPAESLDEATAIAVGMAQRA